MLILTIFFPKKCNFEKFSTSESEKYGEIFSQFFCRQGKKSFFFGRIFTYECTFIDYVYCNLLLGYRTPVQTTFGPGGSVVTSSSSNSTSFGPPPPVPGPGSRPPSQGFLPGHPLVKDVQRPFGSEYYVSR